jgi:putative spermidine/putrescine transport system ATP-binding protein
VSIDDHPFLTFDHVSKSYDGERLVVDDLNLEVKRGEFLTFLGPSGSGKTTSLMLLAGFEALTSGDIRLEGRSLRSKPPHRRNIGMVFQNYALFPHMTVEENLAFPLEARRMGKAHRETKVRTALDLVQLGSFGGRRPSQLSGGQQQRVAVARALIYEPALVLMDEPLGALDKQLRERMQLEIRRIHERVGITVVYVTHDQTEALTMSDRIALFDGGSIEQLSTPKELYERPRTAFVAQFIGENNQLVGVVREKSADTCVVEVGGRFAVKCTPVNVGAVGDKASISVRPESVTIGQAVPGTSATDVNSYPAEVLETIFLGDHVRLRLAVCGTDEFVVKLPRRDEFSDLSVGQKHQVSWKKQESRALKAPE